MGRTEPSRNAEGKAGLQGAIRGKLRNLSPAVVEAAVRRNLAAVVAEIRQTGELAALLAKSSHAKLTDEEWAKVREQLTDVVKTIPALAIFALPGGMILLPILLKLLPFDLRPSAFRPENLGVPAAPAEPGDEDRAEGRADEGP